MPSFSLKDTKAVEIVRKVMGKQRAGLAAYLRTFSGDELERNRTPSRDVEL